MAATQTSPARAEQSAITARVQWAELALVSAVTLLGLGLRLFRLGTWSFWPDEVFSFGNKSDGFNNSLLLRSLATDMIHALVDRWGPSEFHARLIPALIGAATIPLLYLLLRRCMPRWGAITTVALLAVSPWSIYWSQNARFYTLLFLFFNLALLFFYLGIEEDRPLFLVAALVFVGLAARERLVALLGVPALALYLVLLFAVRGFGRPKGLNWRNLIIFFGPGVLAGLVLLFPFLSNLRGWFAGFGRINNSPAFLAAGTIYYIGLPLALFAAGSAFYLLKQRSRLALLLSLGAVLPILLIMAISLFQYAANRYIFFALFCWLALAGLGVQALVDQLRPGMRHWALLTAAVLMAAYTVDLTLYFTVQNGNRDDWRSALAYIQGHGKPGDIVGTTDSDIVNYYLGQPFQRLTWEDAVAEAQQEGQPGQGQPRPTVWFIEDLSVKELLPQQLSWVKQNAREAADFDIRLPGRTYTMRVYERGAPDASTSEGQTASESPAAH